MNVVGLHHAGVHVSDLGRSADFYRAVFGFDQSVAWRLRLGAEVIVFLHAGDARLELIADGLGNRKTGAIDHVALEVDNLDRWLIRLREQGVQLLDDAPIEVPQLGARILFCLGPDGERIELFEGRAPVGEACIADCSRPTAGFSRGTLRMLLGLARWSRHLCSVDRTSRGV
jgi:lactoylglutathione lyase